MRTVLVLTCCVGLAAIAGAAQHDDQNQYKKKGNANAPVQPQHMVTQPTGKHYKAGAGTGAQIHNFQQPNTVGQHVNKAKFHNQSNINSSANATSFNKTKNVKVNKNVTVNKNYKVQKFNLGNNPSGKYQAVKFNQNYHIAGAQNWHGQKYVVFQNYHPVWHDQWWWDQHYHNHITIVFGAPYYWDAGYWYPAWGYNPGASFYFDGPIYASNPQMDPGQVVANVQSALQQEGYYQGEIDGVLGPQTRAALAEYQSAQGIEPTGAVDEPTLETLGMA
jgi:hypothetical protein